MSDRIDELVASADPHMKWLCQRLNVQGTGYEGGPDDRALREVKKAMSQLATIAREAEARAYIERLEAERDALLAEHDAWEAYRAHEGRQRKWDDAWAAHDNAERVIRG